MNSSTDPKKIAKIAKMISEDVHYPLSLLEQDLEGPIGGPGGPEDMEPDMGQEGPPEDFEGPEDTEEPIEGPEDMDMVDEPSPSIEMDSEFLGLILGHIKDLAGEADAEDKIEALIDAVVQHGTEEEELEAEPTGRVMTGQEDFEEIMSKLGEIGGGEEPEGDMDFDEIGSDEIPSDDDEEEEYEEEEEEVEEAY